MSDINEVRERLERDANGFLESDMAVSDVTDLRALLADHARLQAEAITTLRIPEQPGMDPITVYIDSPEAGAAAVTIRCYSSAWAACAWTAYWGSMGSDAVKFMASVNADYMEGCMLWPNASAVPKREREYARRVAQAVIDHCRELVAQAVQP